jgi:Secretion system C-terminal sorting domain/Pregnancy-associated plasma protein-A
MKKTIKLRNIFMLLVASFLMLTSSLTAQTDGCLVDFPDYEPEPPTGSNLWCLPQSKEYNVRIAFHIVRNSDGTGGTSQAELNKVMAILSTDFNPTITFTVVSIDDVKSTADKNYFSGNAYKLSTISTDPTPPLFFDLVQENKVADALNVYLGPASNPNDGGIASPSRLACTIGGSRVDLANTVAKYMVVSRAVSHEVAHLIGLLHPHQANGVPLVNGSNCSTTGDFVCDTPADPSQPIMDLPNFFDFRPLLTNGCVWNNTTKMDTNGDLFHPSTSNIMAYTHLRCMNNFTEGQFRRMHNYCLTNTFIKPAVTVYDVNWFGCGGGVVVSSFLKTVIKTEELNYRVFPNPASEFLAIHFLSESKETEIKVTDIMGKSLYKKSLGRTTKQDVHEIDFSILPKGIHILTVSNDLEKKTTKIVIQ